MSEQNSKKYATTLPGYNCTTVYCKGNERVSKYKEQNLCEDIGCEDQTDGRCMTKEAYDKSMSDSKDYHCSVYSAPIKITNAKIHSDKLYPQIKTKKFFEIQLQTDHQKLNHNALI